MPAVDPNVTDTNIKQWFAELLRSQKANDFERALKTCNRITKARPNDEKARHCQIVCHIKLGRFEEALLSIKKITAPAEREGLRFEKAYCEYRQNRLDEAIRTIGSANDFNSTELLAQCYYKSEEYQKAKELYEYLLKHSIDAEWDENRQTNLLACISQLELQTKTHNDADVAFFQQQQESCGYEQRYNYACVLANAGKLEAASKEINKAIDDCRGAADVDDEEIEEEAALLQTQKAYILQCMGNGEAAAEINSEILKQKPADAQLSAIAANNLLAQRKEQLLFDSRKKMKACMGKEVQNKMNMYQKAMVTRNVAIMQMLCNQMNECHQTANQLTDVFHMKEEAVLIKVAALIRQKQIGNARKLLQEFIGQTSGSIPMSIQLVFAHLQLLESQLGSCLESLRRLSNEPIMHMPGMVSTAVAICLAINDNAASVQFITDAVEWQKKQTPVDVNSLMTLLEAGANLQAKLGQPQKASVYLQQLRQLKKGDPIVLARLLKAYSDIDPAKAEGLCAELSKLEGGVFATPTSSADLEDSSWLLLGSKYSGKKLTSKTKDEAEVLAPVKQRHKRKRKAKLPKNLDPNAPPDPERWLPKWERSTYKKRKDKRQREKDVGRGTQGAVDPSLEVNLQKQANANEASTPGSPKAPTAGAPRPPKAASSSQPKPKKKKGRGK